MGAGDFNIGKSSKDSSVAQTADDIAYSKYLDDLEMGKHSKTSGMDAVDAAKYQVALGKLDANISISKVNSNEILDVRKVDIGKTKGLLSGVEWKDVGKGSSYSGDLMSPEEAARYSEHWRELGMGSDKTWNDFIKANPGSTIENYNTLIKEQSPWPIGQSGNANVLKEGDRFFMAVENNAPDSMIGGFGIKEKIPSTQFIRGNLAVKSDWKTTCNVISEFEINKGASLDVLEGPVGPQIDLKINKYLPGDMSITQYNLFSKLKSGSNLSDYVHIVDEFWVD